MSLRTMALAVAALLLSGCNQGSDEACCGAPHQKSHAAAPGPAKAGAEHAAYVCPMHPDVTSATPGKCPKCGMTLVANQEKPAAKEAGAASRQIEHMHN